MCVGAVVRRSRPLKYRAHRANLKGHFGGVASIKKPHGNQNRCFFDIKPGFLKVHKVQVEVHRGQAEVHKAYVEVHEAYVEVHKAQVEVHGVEVRIHRPKLRYPGRFGTPSSGTNATRGTQVTPGPPKNVYAPAHLLSVS